MEGLIPVLIIDDEKFVIEDLCTLTDWRAHGFDIRGVAYNGKVGLRKWREFHPKLILTDIRMPYMDGIEMIRAIRREDQKVNIILLTAYEDFAYAKAAISLGISEYLIKGEITSESLSALLIKQKKLIQDQNRQDRIVTGRRVEQFFSEEGDKESKLYGAEYVSIRRNMILIRQDLPILLTGDRMPEGVEVPRLKRQDLLEKCDYQNWKVDVTASISSEMTLLVLSYKGADGADYSEELRKCAESVIECMHEMTSYRFSAWYFDRRLSLKEARSYCRKYKDCFEQAFFAGSGKARRCRADEAPQYSGAAADVITGGHEDTLLPAAEGRQAGTVVEPDKDYHYLLDLPEPEISGAVERLISGFRTDRNKSGFSRTARMLYSVLYEAFSGIAGSDMEEDFSVENNWYDWIDIDRMEKWFIDRFEKYATQQAAVSQNYSEAVSEAIRFIYLNYRNPDLSLEMIAANVNLSAGYLSGKFKKEVGVTIKNFITKVRIDTAKRMLVHGEKKISKISSETGYRSSQYFSQAFYKEAGVFPTEYHG